MTPILVGAFSLLLCASLTPAQTAKLLKDINVTPVPTPSRPHPAISTGWTGQQTFARVGSVLLVAATTEAHGTELWVSGGTAANTLLLKDIHPGPGSSDPDSIRVTADGKTAFFTATDGKLGMELWRTDGTSAGTVLVKDILAGSGGSYPDEIVAFGPSSVVFSARDLATGAELYISDGTSNGTRLLKDIRPGNPSGSPLFLRTTRDGKKVFFTATDNTNGLELWITDGTTAGTKMVKDIYVGALTSGPLYPTPLGSSQIVFEADDGINGRELWVSDGTGAGTRIVTKLAMSKLHAGATSKHAVAVGKWVIFKAYSASQGWEVYTTDGTAKGTQLLVDAWPGTQSGEFFSPHLDSAGKRVYWISNISSPWDRAVFTTDGTPAGTKRFTTKGIGGWPYNLVESLGSVYFQSYDLNPGTGQELCVSDGTLAGTKTLRDTYPGQRDGGAHYLTRFNQTMIFFAADDGVVGTELWSMSSGKNFQRIDINKPKVSSTMSSGPVAPVRFGKYVLFSANDGEGGWNTWISDGTEKGTNFLKDLDPGFNGRLTKIYAAAGDLLVFDGETRKTGVELFVTDGTPAGTRLLKDISPGYTSSDPTYLTSIGGKVYFACGGGGSNVELWITDGTAAGTRLVKDIYPGSLGSSPYAFAGQGKNVVFRAQTAATGAELYITDGSAAGTRLLKDINPGPSGSNPAHMTYCGGRVYFSAYTAANGVELWVTDFTKAGTTLLKDINPGVGHSNPAYLSARNGKIYFSAFTVTTGRELFISDGSSSGTRLYLDYAPGSQDGNPKCISALGSRRVYFTAFTAGMGIETVVTDGTSVGTQVVDINPGAGDGYGYFDGSTTSRLSLGSQVFMGGYNPLYGAEIFTVDNGATAEPLGTPYGSTWIHGSDPILGKTASIVGGTKLANAVHVTLIGSVAARPIRFGRSGFLHFDAMRYSAITGISTGPAFNQFLSVPNTQALKGVQVVLQTLAFDGKNLTGTLELSNGLHWSVGQ